MKIAFLGWGSLIWDESREFKIDDGWKKDGPKLPIEFARISRDGRLTLVLYSDAQLIEVLWAEANTEDLDEARCNLQEREKANYKDIHYVSLDDNNTNSKVAPEILDGIIRWARTKKLDAVVWTGLDSKFKNEFNEDSAVEYLKGLENGAKQKAKEYIQKAPCQIRTKVRERVEQELGWKQ